MPKISDNTIMRTVTTYRTVVVAIIIVAVGLVILYFSGFHAVEKAQPALQALMRELGALLVVTGGLAVLWDLKGRRDFAEEVLAKAQVGADIRSSGLRRLTMQWLQDIDWANMILRAREIEIFVAYGASWRNVLWPRFQEFSQRSQNKLRVYLPHPDDEAAISTLAQRFATTTEQVILQITEAAHAFAGLRREVDGADIRIYYRRGDPTFACYRFDDEIVVTLYSHGRSRGDVPAMLIGPGALYDFFAGELTAIRSQGEEQPSAQLVEGME